MPVCVRACLCVCVRACLQAVLAVFPKEKEGQKAVCSEGRVVGVTCKYG